MRAIARELGLTASAVHYYFPNRSALIDAMIIDGFTSLAGALRTAYDRSPELVPDQRWVALAHAQRAWALRHPAQYLLIYGHTGGAVQRVNPVAMRAMGQVVGVLFTQMRDCVACGNLDAARIEATTPPGLREQFARWRAESEGIDELSDGALAACMLSYSRLHGAIVLELTGHVPPQLSDREALFDLQMRHTADALHHS